MYITITLCDSYMYHCHTARIRHGSYINHCHIVQMSKETCIYEMSSTHIKETYVYEHKLFFQLTQQFVCGVSKETRSVIGMYM